MNYNDFKEMAVLLMQKGKQKTIAMEKYVDYLITSENTDEELINNTFDKMLDLAFVDYEAIKPMYYKLLNYTRHINEDISEWYGNFFVDFFETPKEGINEPTKEYIITKKNKFWLNLIEIYCIM